MPAVLNISVKRWRSGDTLTPPVRGINSGPKPSLITLSFFLLVNNQGLLIRCNIFCEFLSIQRRHGYVVEFRRERLRAVVIKTTSTRFLATTTPLFSWGPSRAACFFHFYFSLIITFNIYFTTAHDKGCETIGWRLDVGAFGATAKSHVHHRFLILTTSVKAARSSHEDLPLPPK